MCSTLSSNLLSMSRITCFPNFVRYAHHSCKVLVIGGGTGGCTMAAKLSKEFNKAPDHVIIVEPCKDHYYQPLYTLIGGGIKKYGDCKKPMEEVLPKNAQWIKDEAVFFQPNENIVKTSNGETIQYQYMIIAMGLDLHWNKVPGLVESLKDPAAQVCSIYGYDTVAEVFGKIRNTEEGNAIFTYPSTPVKCPGAPQKIAYLAEDYWCRKRRRDNINVIYNTSLPNIFGVKKYADALWDICDSRSIDVNLQTNLIEIRPKQKEAVFQDLLNNNQSTMKYSLLHVTPPMGPPKVLRDHKMLTTETGFLDVNPKTMQHNKYVNIFGLGDCTSSPNSKTMAAIASQSKVLYKNMIAIMNGKEMKMAYNGYASCPLVTAPNKCILAEFDYDLKPLETFPYNQDRESYFAYLLKKDVFPFVYWQLMLKGYWNGPELIRKVFSIMKKREPAT